MVNTLPVFGLAAVAVLGLIIGVLVCMAWFEDHMINGMPGRKRAPRRTAVRRVATSPAPEVAQDSAVAARPPARRRPRFLVAYQLQHAVVPGRKVPEPRRPVAAERQTCSQ